MKNGFILIALFIIVAFNSEALSQSADSLTLYELDDVVVTSSRNPKLLRTTPEVMHVVTAEDIALLNPHSTGEILEYLTGVNVESGTGSGYPKRSIVSLDGFPANYSLVMVDGIRLLTEHVHTGQNIDIIPPGNIERIEVIKGAASAQYGSDAMGGIVNIITKKAGAETEASMALGAGSYETYDGTFSIRTPVSDKISISSFGNYEQSDGIPLLAPAHRIDNMGYWKYTTMNNLTWNIDASSDLSCNLFYSQGSMEFLGNDVYNRMVMSSIDYRNYISEKLSLTGRIKYSGWDAEQSSEKNRVVNPELFMVYSTSLRNTITVGTDVKYQKFARTSVLEEDQLAFGAFVQDEYEMDKFSILAALRLDKVENINPVLTPKFAIRYKPVNDLQIRASIGRGFHAPSIQELYEEGYGHGGTAYRFGNPDLQPEYSLTTTMSVEYSPIRNVDLLLHGYYNIINDMITPVYEGVWEENPDTTTTIDKWVRTNIHEARIYGVEATARVRLNGFLIEGGYNYAENLNVSTGGQLPYYPGQSFFSKIIYSYRLSSKLSGSCFISLRATRNRSAWSWKPASDAENDNSDGLVTELADYELLNAGLTLRYKNQFNFFFNLGNLLGQDIERLDDLFTVIDGEPTWKMGCMIDF